MRIAIIGTGMAGMACAYRLNQQVDLTLFESQAEPGGHTHTVEVVEGDRVVAVDTGFMVYNEVTYPLMTQLFRDLRVETVPTEMSFSVQYLPHEVEFSGSSINGLFADRRNFIRQRFWRMLLDVVRFNRIATKQIESGSGPADTLREFVRRHGFGESFLEYYLIPMTSAIWSTPPDEMLNFPSGSLIRFMYNHGLLGITTQHPWRTVKGGSREYRNRLIAPFRDRIKCNAGVTSVRRLSNGQIEVTADHETRLFDKVVMATHADTSLSLLANPKVDEKRLLAAFPYAANAITLHSDISVLPRSRRAWASWNYQLDKDANGNRLASTHYWMNSLQKVSDRRDYIVSVNAVEKISPATIHQQFTFHHPMFDATSGAAQSELPRLNESGDVFFCGSYFRYGFHEDALMSGYTAADAVLSHLKN